MPALPEGLADLALLPGEAGTYAQVTILRCDGVQSLATTARGPALYGAYRAAPPGERSHGQLLAAPAAPAARRRPPRRRGHRRRRLSPVRPRVRLLS
ncbi:MAG: hypothetical protein R3F43_14145 [bacterium]